MFTLRSASLNCNRLTVCNRFCQTNYGGINPIQMTFRAPSIDTPLDPDAKPILIMHGLLGSKNNWNSLAKAIQSKTKKKVFVVDARNHGDSPHTDEFSYAHLAADVELFLRNENIDEAHVLGHSMGGRAMMYLALNKDMGVRQFILTNLKQVSPGGPIIWQCNLNSLHNQFFNHMIQFPLPGERATYHGPTLFIGGGKSDFIKHEDHAGIRSLFPKADIIYIEGAGHWVHSQKPEQFVSKVVDFYTSPSLS
uniref:sn-1-specific diacylglycerol lipase ABHD11 n=1 Tax=Cacopsylla melanoneura TaxID=428564 RepID=A0A8D8Y817_9HEMI